MTFGACYNHAVRISVFVVAGAIALVPTIAGADDTSLHAILDGDVAATDNVFSAPGSGLPGEPREADVYVQVRPGLLFAYSTPRMIQDLSAQLEVLEYVRNYGTPTVTARAKWDTFFQVTPLTEIGTLVGASTGRANALTEHTTPDQTMVGVLPSGAIDVDEVDASEHHARDWRSSPQLRVNENGGFGYTYTNDQMGDTTSALLASASASLERTWPGWSVGVEVGATYLDFDRTAVVIVDPTLPNTDREFDPHVYLIGRHDFNRNWTANVTAGAVEVIPTDADRPMQTFPVASVVVGYSDFWGFAAATVARAVTPNMFVADNTVTDSVTANVSLPLPWLRGVGMTPTLLAAGAIGVNRTQLVDATTGDLTSSFDVFRLDLGVTYAYKPGVTFGLRYDFLDQSADAAAAAIAPGFTRNTLFFDFAYRWPPEVLLVPRRTGMRADGKDVQPVGDELLVPEVAAPAADGTSDGGPGPTPATPAPGP